MNDVCCGLRIMWKVASDEFHTLLGIGTQKAAVGIVLDRLLMTGAVLWLPFRR